MSYLHCCLVYIVIADSCVVFNIFIFICWLIRDCFVSALAILLLLPSLCGCCFYLSVAVVFVMMCMLPLFLLSQHAFVLIIAMCGCCCAHEIADCAGCHVSCWHAMVNHYVDLCQCSFVSLVFF